MRMFLTRTLVLILCCGLATGSANAAFVNTEKTRTVTTTPDATPAGIPATESEESNLLSSAENALGNMTKAERRSKMREVRKALRQWRHSDPRGENTTSLVLLIILAILIPPLAVGLYERRLSSKFWISLLLTLLFFLPGMIYSLLVVTGVA